MKRNDENLVDGEYVAHCRQKTMILAAANGHSSVWPSARMVIANKTATFYRDGAPVWACNAQYAAAHFDVRALPIGWFTDIKNRAGTAHFFRIEGAIATSRCGRSVAADSLQGESESLRQCSRCLKALASK